MDGELLMIIATAIDKNPIIGAPRGSIQNLQFRITKVRECHEKRPEQGPSTMLRHCPQPRATHRRGSPRMAGSEINMV